MIENYDWSRLEGLGFAENTQEDLKKACWRGYEAIGMKNKNGRKVPNCVKVKSDSEHGEGDVATAEMTPNYLPKEPIPGGGDLKNPQMGEHKQRMPRMEELKKANAQDGHLAMASAPNYSEDPLSSTEPNGRMTINQLRVIREKVDILLGMLYPDDNLEPWVSTKITMSMQNLGSAADYLRYGHEA